MSRIVASLAISGANVLVGEAERILNETIAAKGIDTPVSFPNTAYSLPTIYGGTGIKVATLGDLISPGGCCPQHAASGSGR